MNRPTAIRFVVTSRLSLRDLPGFRDGVADHEHFAPIVVIFADAELAAPLRRSFRRDEVTVWAEPLTTPAIAVVLVSHDLDDAAAPFS